MMEQNACAGSSVTRHRMGNGVRTTVATELRILPLMLPGRRLVVRRKWFVKFSADVKTLKIGPMIFIIRSRREPHQNHPLMSHPASAILRPL